MKVFLARVAETDCAQEDQLRMTMMKRVVAHMLWSVATVAAFPCSDDVPVEKSIAGHRILAVYGKEENGRSTHCNVIFEDRSGVYWAGTFGGLKRYDEKSGRWNDEIRVPWSVDFIAQSADGKLWFGRRYLRNEDVPNLVSFDGKEWRNIDSLPTAMNHIRSGAVTVIFPGSEGRLWFSRGNQLLAYSARGWSAATEVSKAIRSDFPVSVRAGLQDSEGNIWLATSDGIARFNESKHEWRILDPFGQNRNLQLELKLSLFTEVQIVDGVYKIYEDRKGRVWFASAVLGFYFSYDKRTGSWAYHRIFDRLPAIRPKNVEPGLTKMYQDRFGRMMFGTKMGLITFTEHDKEWQLLTTENSGLPDNLITTIFEDSSGRIWVATGAGIVVLEP